MFGGVYWSTYKRIEKEVLELSHSVYFTDGQVEVYSNEILDLIIRISTNIESLYEDIYRDEFGKTEAHIGPMVAKVGEIYCLEDKIIHINNENFHFRKVMKDIQPFKYEKGDENDFYSAYNALKHNRSKNIKKANIRFLLRSLAAFYALCVIFDDRWTPLQNSFWGTKTSYTFSYNSNIFSADVYDRQLDLAEKSVEFLALSMNLGGNDKSVSVSDMLRQCEKNLKIKFR